MSNNVTLTPNVYAKLVLMGLGGSLKVAKNMSTSMTDEFGRKEFKVGDTVNGRKPYRFVAQTGIGWQPQPIVDQAFPVKVNQVTNVHYQMDTVERTLSMREAMRLYTTPTEQALSNDMNAKSALFAANNALNSVGTPGTPPTTQATYLAAGDVLVEAGLPDEEKLTLIINRKLSSSFVNGTVAYFNPVGTIGGQFQKGHMLDSLGYKIVRDQTINVRTNGVFAGTPLVNGANQIAEGGNNATQSLITDGWTSGGAQLKQGDRFTLGSASSATVGGVEAVYPQTRATSGRQQVFTVQSDVSDTTGALTMTIAPAITPYVAGNGATAANQYANVNLPAVDNAIITMIGTTGLTGITQGLLMHEDAFAFMSVPMWNPPAQGVISANTITDDETGLSISQVCYFDGDNRAAKWRFDCLWDNANMYREMACVIQG